MATVSVVAASINAATWTASSGSLLSCITGEDDGNHIISVIGSSTPFITIPDFGLSGVDINAVRVRMRTRIVDAGSRLRNVGLRLGSATTYYAGQQTITGTSWTEYTWEWTTNPETSAAWTTAEVDGIVRVYWNENTHTVETHIDYIEVEVDYGSGATVAPVADAGAHQTAVEPYSTVTLNGSGSTDPDGTITDYAWTQTGGSPAVMLAGAGHSRTFESPPTMEGTTLTFELTVTDNDSLTDSDTCTITVLPHSTWMVEGGVAATPVHISIIE